MKKAKWLIWGGLAVAMASSLVLFASPTKPRLAQTLVALRGLRPNTISISTIQISDPRPTGKSSTNSRLSQSFVVPGSLATVGERVKTDLIPKGFQLEKSTKGYLRFLRRDPISKLRSIVTVVEGVDEVFVDVSEPIELTSLETLARWFRRFSGKKAETHTTFMPSGTGPPIRIDYYRD